MPPLRNDPELIEPPAPPELPTPRPEPTLPTREPARPVREYLECDFCGCQLTRNGEVLRLGEHAKKSQKHDAAIESLTAERDKLARELATVRAELATATLALSERKGLFGRG